MEIFLSVVDPGVVCCAFSLPFSSRLAVWIGLLRAERRNDVMISLCSVFITSYCGAVREGQSIDAEFLFSFSFCVEEVSSVRSLIAPCYASGRCLSMCVMRT